MSSADIVGGEILIERFGRVPPAREFLTEILVRHPGECVFIDLRSGSTRREDVVEDIMSVIPDKVPLSQLYAEVDKREIYCPSEGIDRR